MCGIFGQVGAPLSDRAAAAVKAVLHHRGPDASGVQACDGGTLLHTRLKVIDLSPAAAQPMTNEDRTVWLTFNGEIYNFQVLRDELLRAGHRFRSRSDSEVIVHGYEEWGDAVVEKLDGMFAFGLWDARRQRLLAARDRTGKKPLFYARWEDAFLFASEIKALLAAGVPSDIDLGGVGSYLAYGYTPPPATVYRAVRQLPPASRLRLEKEGEPAIDRYWRLDFTPRSRVSLDEATEQVRALVLDAVRRRMVADVPVGAFLSGGVDSTVVVGAMAELGQRVKTFSIGFSGDARYDETHFARVAATRFGTEHHEFIVEPKDFSLIETLVWHHDGPFGDSSAIPTYVVSQKTREHVTVALTGDGGDELFAGYLRFWAAALAERIPQPIRAVGGALGRLIPSGLPDRSLPARMRRFLNRAHLPLGDRLVSWNSYFAFTLDEVMQPELRAQVVPDRVLAFHRDLFGQPGASPLAQALTHNFETYLPYDLLVKMDRTSMAHALETRAPLLDTALLEYVAALPDDFKLHGRTSKFILRRAFADLIPPEIQRRGKMGFGLPLGTWFRTDLRGYLRDQIASPRARIYEFVRPAYVTSLFDAHEQGRADNSHQLWALLTMELWLRNLPALARPRPAEARAEVA